MLKRNSRKQINKKKKGQSTIEYIILVAGVLAILLVFLGPNGIFQSAYNKMLMVGTDGMVNMANRVSQGHSNPAP